MNTPSDEYDKILNFLRQDDTKNISLGLELLKFTRNSEIISRFLSSPSYVSGLVSFPLVPFFQENPEVWESVQQNIPEYHKRQIQEWMPYTILQLKNPDSYTFCQLAQREVQKIFPDFPALSLDILNENDHDNYFFTQFGKKTQGNMTWSLSIESRYLGPAEVIQEDEWSAIASHPECKIQVKHIESRGMIPQTWLNKIYKT
jgi:hypothetical protein